MKSQVMILITALFILTGCKQVDKFTQFQIEYDQSVVIPSTAGIELPISLSTPEIETNSESTFAVRDTRKELIEEITLTDLDITLTSPSDGDLSFLESVEIFISSNELPEERVAWKEDISPTIGGFLELETSDTDLKEYIKRAQFSLRVVAVTDETLGSDHEIDIHSEFFVDAKILGQ